MTQTLKPQLDALQSLAEHRSLDAVVLRDPLNIAWLTGARWHVPHTLDTACFDAVVEGLGTAAPSIRIVASQIEAPRLRDTELSELPVSYDVVPWEVDRTTRLPSGDRVGWDRPGSDANIKSVALDMADTRRILTSEQRASLRALCSDAAAIVGQVAASVRRGETEQQVAGRVLNAFAANGIDTVALFVAADDRGEIHRHPLPTDRVIERQAMIACCSRRDGVVASTTRFVSFQLSMEEASQYRALLEVEAAFLDASLPGRSIGEVFSQGVTAYEQHGFEREEWRRHHQGGVTGFSPRELIAHAGTSTPLRAGMALAWNPSAAGFKTEDTVLVWDDGVEVLGSDADWPTHEVSGRLRPAILEL